MEKKIVKYRIVVSAVNFTEGGPLTVLRDCLSSAVANLPDNFELIAFVNRAELINEPRVRLISIPSAKKSWFYRLYWEWFGFNRISRELKPDLWISLHDITPRVAVRRQVVYCHNPSPFYRISMREIIFEPKLLAFNLFYALLYRVFIFKNHCVIVQQAWLRDEFKRRMGSGLNVVVAHPTLEVIPSALLGPNDSNFVFLYPALPRVFKNIETLCEAACIVASRGVSCFEVRITLSGSENYYARWLHKKYGNQAQIRFIGRQSKSEMDIQYINASAVVFPSKLETWGLPITEAKARRLPLLIADLPYAKETVGDYDLVSFFSVKSANALADLMQSLLENKWKPAGNEYPSPKAPFAANWEDLWRILISGLMLTENKSG